MKAEQVLEELRRGNERFREGRMVTRDYASEGKAAVAGQSPGAVVLSCMDSRVPVEAIFDQGIGDVFVLRVAGNVVNADVLGSLEFATRVVKTHLVVVLGHTDCGAVKGAIAGVELGHLTGLLERLGPAVEEGGGDVDAVIEANVRRMMAAITRESGVVGELVERGEVVVVGGVYDLATRAVRWL
ncbi:carbonic anhydrase [Mucisphaera calidilacus]|uniref:Carbonic anhydrase 2 n=1 Tax=Mucisphaera calidilacus TaxID=2527982 RepID=A0A518BVW5_9BACT|nr:carbonic anhydrase [Mucisphaera calidilacus]QDU71115.1 Carbonic anhydrase 2 [Mucisphaera calidilacus]